MFSMIISIAMLIAWVISHNDILIIGAGLFRYSSWSWLFVVQIQTA